MNKKLTFLLKASRPPAIDGGLQYPNPTIYCGLFYIRNYSLSPQPPRHPTDVSSTNESKIRAYTYLQSAL